jgi:hypothetical protein
VRTTRVTLFSDADVPDDLTDFINWINGLLAQGPMEHRASARIDINSDSDGCIDIEVYYYRPMTPGEREQEDKRHRSRFESEVRRLETALDQARKRLVGP